jgi:hypothetical protein
MEEFYVIKVEATLRSSVDFLGKTCSRFCLYKEAV